MQFTQFTPENIFEVGNLQPDGWPDITNAFNRY